MAELTEADIGKIYTITSIPINHSSYINGHYILKDDDYVVSVIYNKTSKIKVGQKGVVQHVIFNDNNYSGYYIVFTTNYGSSGMTGIRYFLPSELNINNIQYTIEEPETQDPSIIINNESEPIGGRRRRRHHRKTAKKHRKGSKKTRKSYRKH